MKMTTVLLAAVAGMIGMFAAASEITVKSAQSGESSGFLDLPAVTFRHGDRVVLEFSACVKRPAPCGWSPVVSFRLNRNTLKQFDSKKLPRLLGEETFTTRIGGKEEKTSWWYQNFRLYTFFGPGKGAADSRIVSPGNIWDFRLDVTDLTVSGKPNRLEVFNWLSEKLAGGIPSELELKNIRLTVIPSAKS